MARDFLRQLKANWLVIVVGGCLAVGTPVAKLLGYFQQLPAWAIVLAVSASLVCGLLLMWGQQYQELKTLRAIPYADRASMESLPASAAECCAGLGAFDVGSGPYQNAVSTVTSLRMAGARLVLWPDVEEAVRQFASAADALIGDRTAPRSGLDAPTELSLLKERLRQLVSVCRHVLATGTIKADE